MCNPGSGEKLLKCSELRVTAPRHGYSLGAPITKRSALERGSDLEFLVARGKGSDLEFLAGENPKPRWRVEIRDLTPSYGLIAEMTLPMN